jgi:circadian clock protein KaiB
VRRIIGDLSDRERVLIGLDLLYDELSDESFALDQSNPPQTEAVAEAEDDAVPDFDPSSGAELRPGAP